VKIFLDILSSSILSRWPCQLILCPFIHFNSPYYHLLKYLLFLLKHPVYKPMQYLRSRQHRPKVLHSRSFY
jgi:hypothetical protein